MKYVTQGKRHFQLQDIVDMHFGDELVKSECTRYEML